MKSISIGSILNLHDVVYLSSLSRSTIYRQIALGKFPKPVRFGQRRKGWRRLEVEKWLRDPEQFQA
ncbi:MAG: AlpA family phage regulatory protein [Sphingopyxis sp.]|jgi:prophage regulatory protein|uniref:helix-turn-helix transcriptional regulator n=1 Tax=Sphingopyxis sp. TaxID=1908224 RepID=UPI001A363557|nr:AlpA family phage regulatory protein [Sphingopyxis sp.]MBL9070509.1 AlpA family phage regulatory protein [Sphingopyxis sp.]